MDWNEHAILLEVYAKRQEELKEVKRKLEVYRDAINSIGIMGHVDVNGQYEKAYNVCLDIASKAYIDSGDYEEDFKGE